MLRKRPLYLLFALQACAAEPDPAPPPRERPPVTSERLPDVPPGHPDMEALRVLSRGPRRMTVSQIERSLDVAANLPLGTVKLDDNLALALGRPDYLRVTEESLEPSPLFMKFMLDLGGAACRSLAQAEDQRPEAERVLTRFPDVEENLRYILLRFTGLEDSGADPYVERLRAVYSAASSGPNGSLSGWEAVCIAVFASPEFLLY